MVINDQVPEDTLARQSSAWKAWQVVGSAWSRGVLLVAMMKPTDFWNLHDPAPIGWLDFSGF
jgi:hypothetical protein